MLELKRPATELDGCGSRNTTAVPCVPLVSTVQLVGGTRLNRPWASVKRPSFDGGSAGGVDDGDSGSATDARDGPAVPGT